MATTLSDDIKRNEDQIFEYLRKNEYVESRKDYDDDDSCLQSNPSPMLARLKARQQLRVSDDNPFNYLRHEEDEINEQELNRLREEKAKLLREETEDIKQQLELVKSRLGELKAIRSSADIDTKSTVSSPQNQGQTDEYLCDRHRGQQNSVTKESESKREVAIQTGECQEDAKEITKSSIKNQRELRLRPLTGKADCPNCSCDRRQSVCDKCLEFPISNRPAFNSQVNDNEICNASLPKSIDTRRPSFFWRSEKEQDKNGIEKSQQNIAPKAYNDDRPIRPAPFYRQKIASKDDDEHQKDKLKARVEVCVDHQVVPSKIYTIGKSLNDKRSKLAQAIEELKCMTEKVKQKGDRLEEERKVAQLYKQQWRYGPAIGGGISTRATSIQRSKGSFSINQQNYSSRLDPSLARDTNSLMGFQHIESSMKLRQYSSIQAPRPKPRFNKMAAQTASSRAKMVNNSQASVHLRSKSLESLGSIKTKSQQQQAQYALVMTKSKSENRASSQFSNGKSASETNLSSPVNSPDGVEEQIEEEIREEDNESDNTSVVINDNAQNKSMSHDNNTNEDKNSPQGNSPEVEQTKNQEKLSSTAQEKVQKLSWIPVFGETEIKTITKRTPKRKIQVLYETGVCNRNRPATAKMGQPAYDGARKTASILRSSRDVVARNGHSLSGRSKSGDRVLNEANKKLQFANDLLEQERYDSTTKNQILIKRNIPQQLRISKNRQSPTKQTQSTFRLTRAKSALIGPTPGYQLQAPTTGNSPNDVGSDKSFEQHHHDFICEASRESQRLEQIISQQQKLLDRLAEAQRADKDSSQVVAPRCPCPCCSRNQDSTAIKTQLNSSVHCPLSHQSVTQRAHLIHHLRGKLNKTKARLAKTLEEEKTRHHKLEQRVDSSLRKQSDLQNENEILKKSLGECIDTCLKDISNTFESLSDTLNDSMSTNLHSLSQSRRQLVDGTAENERDEEEESNHQDSSMAADSSAATLHNISTTSSSTSISSCNKLTNAAQLIEDNQHLRRLKAHIEAIERQRRGIFEELSNEKQRSQRLELELSKSKNELNKLMAAKQHLESNTSAQQELPSVDTSIEIETNVQDRQPAVGLEQQLGAASSSSTTTTVVASSSKAFVDDPSASHARSCSEDNSSTFNSIDIYRKYIQSMSPDLEAIRRERQMILSEFDSIKKMLIEMDK